MTPRHGEVWLVDMGMVAKTRPGVVLIADNLDAPRSLIIAHSHYQTESWQ
jgi:mRNA-degrading endonuclease toxin of MazEF toxin-antitoxin module